MAKTCRTSDGDRLYSLCHNVYGHLNGSVEAVLEANPGLAAEPQPFRAGLLILLPDLPQAASEEVIQLWG
jgi:phage tail protein X